MHGTHVLMHIVWVYRTVISADDHYVMWYSIFKYWFKLKQQLFDDFVSILWEIYVNASKILGRNQWHASIFDESPQSKTYIAYVVMLLS